MSLGHSDDFQLNADKGVVRSWCVGIGHANWDGRRRCAHLVVTKLMKNLIATCAFATLSTIALMAPPMTAGQAQMQVRKALVNQDIVLMVKSKFADSTIIKLIRANETQFDVSVPAVVQLKSAGVSQGVIETMIAASTTKPVVAPTTSATIPRPAPAAPAPQVVKTPEMPDEIGVYFRTNGKLVSIEPEIVSWRTGGVVKQNLTLGWDKGHINGTVRGSRSPLDVTSGSGAGGVLEFLVRCPEGDAASEYQLIHFWVKSDRREFRTVTGGVFHASGGAQDNVIDFKYEKVAARTYKIELRNPGAGEYGFLAPGTTASLNAASQGKIYTFSLAE
jgi:hypothetical protein